VTPFERISAVAAHAATLSRVALRETFSVRSARILDDARIDAVSVNAGATAVAFGIASTAD
jgi:hypothetical protein